MILMFVSNGLIHESGQPEVGRVKVQVQGDYFCRERSAICTPQAVMEAIRLVIMDKDSHMVRTRYLAF